jgi:K+-transporting ATPase ATPase C chain
MRRDLLNSALAVLVLSAVLGLGYPLATTGLAHLLFPGKAGGSRVERGGQTIGSRLIGQSFAGTRGYFQSRPSATGYDAAATSFDNLGPNSAALSRALARNLRVYLRREHPYDPSLARSQVPVDAVTYSASGVDPEISQVNARIQAHRVATVRGLPLRRVLDLVARHTHRRGLGLFGEPGVNVLELNLELAESGGR